MDGTLGRLVSNTKAPNVGRRIMFHMLPDQKACCPIAVNVAVDLTDFIHEYRVGIMTTTRPGLYCRLSLFLMMDASADRSMMINVDLRLGRIV